MAGKNVASSVSDPSANKTVAASYQNKGTWKTAKNIVKNRGLSGLYSGFSLHLRKSYSSFIASSGTDLLSSQFAIHWGPQSIL
jgi:hypothetical protein